MKYSCERRGQDWVVRLADDSELPWIGFTTGPVVLDDEKIAQAAHALLDMTPDAASRAARIELRPYVAEAGESPPAVLLHSATQTTKGFEGDLADVQLGRLPYDVAGYLEARAVSLAAPGDIAVGRTQPWREATEIFDVAAIDIGDTDHYYLLHALLVMAQRHRSEPVAPLAELINWVSARPTAVVRLYALDLETQIFLLWLRRMAELPTLHVDANAPVIAREWNRKNGLHPTVTAARAIEPELVGLPVVQVLEREQMASEAYRRLDMRIPVTPGYRVERGLDVAEFQRDLLLAVKLLRERHGLSWGCLKPCEAGDGARIVPGIPLDDHAALARHAMQAYQHGDDYLLEAHVEFRDFSVAGRKFIVAPSGHIRGGHVAEGLTVQLMHGCSWEGNALVDERTAESLGISGAAYADMIATMHTVRDAFYGPQAEIEGCHGGLVMGGVDFAFGAIGGHYGDGDFVGVIDLNLSSHGAEYMRAFHDEVRRQASDVYVATRVFRPAAHATLGMTEKLIRKTCVAYERAHMIACVPGRWGMVATTGTDTLAATTAALRLVDVLVEHGLASQP